VVLIHKNRGPDAVRGKYNGIGGHVEEGESLVAAMVREFEEETGARTTERAWGNPYVRLYGDDWEVNFFRHFEILPGLQTGDGSPTDERVIHASVYPHLLVNVVPNLRWLIPMALDMCLDPEQTIQIHDVVPQ
jgi:8-oxo-dGTP diphosphatase